MWRSALVLLRGRGAERTAPTQIHLSEWETKVFRFLRRVAAATSTVKPVELRVAGGWVRDKLLGKHTGDIDIAVRQVTGFQFASRLHGFALEKSVEYGSEISTERADPELGCAEYVPDISSVAMIDPNPSMSRHLETAAIRLDGHDLDFVELRTEDYVLSSENRIPQNVAAGTPKQDSSRRDFTVNALFYNLHTSSVEDHTGYGLRDLADGVLRTPLDARVTLLEDPLRALRALRFACRLQFDLHASLCEALSGKEVREALHRKVSRERIGSEFVQIIQTDGVLRGLEWIAQYNLIEPVFMDTFASRISSEENNYREGVGRVRRALELFHANAGLFTDREIDDSSAHGRKVLVLAALIWDTTRIPVMLQHALRRDKRLQQDVRRVLLLSIRLEQIVREWYSVRKSGNARKEGELWIEIAETVREAGASLWIPVCIAGCLKVGNDELLRDLVSSGICTNLCRVSYAVNGRRLQAELGIRPGPEVGKALRELMQLQLWYYRRRTGDGKESLALENPVPSPDVCIQLLKARRSSVDGGLGR